MNFQEITPGTAKDLIPRLSNPEKYLNTENPPESVQEVDTFYNLPDVSESELVSSIIKTILGFSMSLTIIAIVVAGIIYLTSMGDEEKAGKAKKIILYLVIGFVIMASAYAIITGIAKFNFFVG